MNQPRATLAAGMQVTPSVRLLSPLGEGGMGAVWLADHTALATRVVVKFMLGGLDSSTSARARFKREAEAASQVKSPHVVQTFDYGVTSDGVPFIVMEHLEGRDLGREIAEQGALPPARVVAIVQQVARALSKAHAAGLLHRDIKPDNIFLLQHDAEDELFVKLLDFGIAKTSAAEGEEITLDGQTKTGQVVGTPFYMSPEQVTAQKVIDARSDLWALGVVAYEALTGQRPFDGPSFGALAVKIATGDAPRPSAANAALPPAIDAWFAKACARDPARRFATSRELSDAFRAAFDGVVSLPPLPPRPSDAGEGSGSRPRLSSDSGARGDRRSTPGPSLPPGPISVDDDAHDRPSFVLASTIEGADGSDGEKAAGDRSSLARSEPGGAALASADAPSPYPRRRPAAAIAAVLLATILVAGAIGVTIGQRDPSSGGAASALAKGTPAPPKPTSIELPTVTTAAPTSVLADAALAVLDDAAPPLSPTAPVTTRVAPLAPIAPLAPVGTKGTPSAKPTDSAAPVRPNGADAGRNNDPLY